MPPTEKELAAAGYFGFHEPIEDLSLKVGAGPSENKALVAPAPKKKAAKKTAKKADKKAKKKGK